MAGEAQDNVWPLPKFRFSVKWDSETVQFQEVSGLDIDVQELTYRHGDSPVFSSIKMPGIVKYGDVTMKKGVFAKDNKFWAWYAEIKMNVIKRKPVTISLLDEAGGVTMVWTLTNAWPKKITATDMKSEGNEVAVGTIVIA